MNIFVLHKDPCKAARMLCDKHVVKMGLESVQMLVIPFIQQEVELSSRTQKGSPYKVAHLNHPCSIWTRMSRGNWNWLAVHCVHVFEEYSLRYKKKHYCEAVLNEMMSKAAKLKFPYEPLTPFAKAMPMEYQEKDAVLSYRTYYTKSKSAIASYSFTKAPSWFKI